MGGRGKGEAESGVGRGDAGSEEGGGRNGDGGRRREKSERLVNNWILMSCQPHRVTSGTR